MIGVYDSGMGGLSVLKELIELMPGEDFTYFSDDAYCPYGPKDPDFIRERASVISQELIKDGAEMIVVACNTATAAAISFLREKYPVPFVGMEPAVKPAAINSKTGVIGVLATEGTFKGSLYHTTLEKLPDTVKIIECVGEGLVETVEKGLFDGPVVESLIHKCIDPMLAAGADHIVLGCTHYPFLKTAIEKIAGTGVTVINPAPAVARQAEKILSGLRNVRHCGIGHRCLKHTGPGTEIQSFFQTFLFN